MGAIALGGYPILGDQPILGKDACPRPGNLTMAVTPLSPFIDLAPGVAITDSPAQWQRDCLLAAADGVALLDQDQQPLGWLPLGRILLISQAQPPSAGITPGSPPPQISTLLEPVAIIVQTLSPQEARTLVQGSSDRPWLVVDPQRRYVGKLNLARLWDALQHPTTSHSAAPATTTAGDSALLSYLGHELKTPLTSLLGLTSLLQRETQEQLNPRQARYLSHIQTQTRRLTALVNGVLDLSRLAAGTLHLMPQIVEIAPLCQEAYRQAQLVVGNPPSPTDHPDTWADTWPHGVMVADALRLGQMVSYLLQLALRANPPPSETLLNLEQWGSWSLFHPWSRGLTLGSLPIAGKALPSPDPTTLGSGWLELLLIRHLAQAHSGELALTPHDDGRLRPVLLLPGGQEGASTPEDRAAGQLAVVVGLDEEVAIALGPPLRTLGYYPLALGSLAELQGALPHLRPAVIIVSLLDAEGIQTLKTLLQTPPTALLIALSPALPPGASQSTLVDFPSCSPLPWPSPHLEQALSTALATATQAPPPSPAPLQRVTVLTLKAHESPTASVPGAIDLSSWLQEQGCQVLEVDDVDQALLLSRVWRPDALVVDPHLPHPETYLQALGQFPSLTNLPLITLTPGATAAAIALGGLRLFPCGVETPDFSPPCPPSATTQWLLAILRPALPFPPKGKGKSPEMGLTEGQGTDPSPTSPLG